MKLTVHNLVLVVDTSKVGEPAETATDRRLIAQGAIEHLNNTLKSCDGISIRRVDHCPVRNGDVEIDDA